MGRDGNINDSNNKHSPQSPEVKTKFSRLQVLLQTLANAKNLNEALNAIVAGVIDALEVELCSVYLRDDEHQCHQLLASQGLRPKAVGQTRIPSHTGIVSYISDHKEVLNLANAHKHPNFYLLPDIGEEDFHGCLGVPIIHQSDSLGVVLLQRQARRKFSPSSVAFMQTLAVQLGSWIALAKIRGELSQTEPSVLPKSEYISALVGSKGIAIGSGVLVAGGLDLAAIPQRQITDIEVEVGRFEEAVQQVASDYQALAQQVQPSLGSQEAELFEAYAAITASPEIRNTTLEKIRAGHWAPSALQETINDYTAQFRAMDDAYLRERASDIEEIGQRLLAVLLNREDSQLTAAENTILVGEHLTPTDLMRIPEGQLKGIISGQGSSHSHLAILARALNIPALLGVADLVPLAELEGKNLCIDGHNGRLYIEPSTDVLDQYRQLIAEQASLAQALIGLRDQPAVTTDGHKITLLTNAGITTDLTHSQLVGAEGIGLYRTELPFIYSEYFLTEDEQFNLYRQVLEQFKENSL